MMLSLKMYLKIVLLAEALLARRALESLHFEMSNLLMGNKVRILPESLGALTAFERSIACVSSHVVEKLVHGVLKVVAVLVSTLEHFLDSNAHFLALQRPKKDMN